MSDATTAPFPTVPTEPTGARSPSQPADPFATGVVVLAAALGVLLIAFADTASRSGDAFKQLFFWGGLLLICAPAAMRLAGRSATRGERLVTVVCFGLAMYLTKVAYSPSRLAFSDEFVHLRSIQDDLASGRLFSFNPLLPEAARYPGLGAVTSGLVRLSGLPTATAGFIVIGAARIVLMLSIFLVIEQLAGSQRVAGLAALLYAGNPNFLFWSAQLSYESLALPLVAFTLYLIARRSRWGPGDGTAWLAAAGVVAVVITHHLSSYFLAAVLVVWSAVALRRRRRRPDDLRELFVPIWLAALALTAIDIWLAAVASVTSGYLGSIASSTGRSLFDVVTGSSATRALFTSGSAVAPTWERALSVLAVAVTVAGLGVAFVLVWKARRTRPLLLAPLALGLTYPLLLPLRFIGGAAETANRSTEFLYLGLGATLALVAVAFVSPASPRLPIAERLRTVSAAGLCVLVLAGGAAIAWQYSERLPQARNARAVPYELAAPALAADRFAATSLGPGKRFASDFLNHLGLATYGHERPLYAPRDEVSAWQIMQPERVEQHVREAITRGHVQFVLVERRLSEGIPASGFYFDKGEPEAGKRTRPISLATLAKFDRTRNASRVYDNGDERIYEVGRLR